MLFPSFSTVSGRKIALLYLLSICHFIYVHLERKDYADSAENNIALQWKNRENERNHRYIEFVLCKN